MLVILLTFNQQENVTASKFGFIQHKIALIFVFSGIFDLNIQDILVAYPAKTDMFSHVGFL